MIFLRGVVLLLLAATGVLTATAAHAAASLETVETDSDSITLRFDGAVKDASVMVFDQAGRIQKTEAVGVQNGVVEVDAAQLRGGEHFVVWSATAADGERSDGATAATVPGSADGTSALYERMAPDVVTAADGVVAGVLAAVAYVASVVGVGAVLFLVWLWPAGWRVAIARRLIWVAVAMVAAASAGSLVVVESDAAPMLWARIGACVLLLVVLAAVPRTGEDRAPWRPRGWQRMAITVACLAVVAPTAWLAQAPDVTAVLVDVVGTLAMAAWLGGVVTVAVAMSRASAAEAAKVIPRFSDVALVSVGLVIVSSVLLSRSRTGSFAALITNDVGEVLLIKAVIFFTLIAIAVMARRWVRRRFAVESVKPLKAAGAAYVDSNPRVGLITNLRQSVKWEAGIAVLLLVLTAMLSNSARSQGMGNAPLPSFSTEMSDPDGHVAVIADPVAVGRTDIHFYGLTPRSQVMRMQSLDATLSLPAKGIPPLPVKHFRAGPDHFQANGVVLPTDGVWTLSIVATGPTGAPIEVSTEIEVAPR